MGKTKFTKTPKNSKESEAVGSQKEVLHQEPKHHGDDETTASNFPFHQLIPNWRTFGPNIKDPVIGSKFASTHHGGSGARESYRVRCMNVFTVDSNQCTTHGKTTHKDGPNKIYTYMKRNETATWGVIKDANLNQEVEELPEWQRGQQNRGGARAENEADSELDPAALRRAALDDKLKNRDPNRRKTGYKSVW